jgi:MFS family permease
MALHQSSVYAGTIAGGAAAGYFGQLYGWRSGFYVFGALGVALGLVLVVALREPARGQAEADDPDGVPAHGHPPARAPRRPIAEVLSDPMVPVLMAVFVGANFVAAIFLTWMPTYLSRTFGMSLAMAGLNGTAWLQIASVLGVLSGGVLADRWARRHPGGRMLTQALGLLAGVPFLFLTGWTLSVPVLVLALAGFGYFKGLYDSNIWASLYDVVGPGRRATALGFMNALGWAGGAVAPVAVAVGARRFGMSACLSASSAIYLLIGVLLIVGVRTLVRPRPAVGIPAAHGGEAVA